MANQLPPQLTERLLATWPALPPETQELLTLVLGSLLPADTPLLQRLAGATLPNVADPPPMDGPTDGTNALRRQIAAYALQQTYAPPPRGAWQHSVGLCAADPLAAEVFAAVQQAREAERPD